ncbi:hypothetical protein NLJ89_g6894 [Agrocybe chaxingu]|uniref:Transmembrane protein n=1 Tax=Agrocybe chaxingu TaxID=84603 RepID=A0A9W8MU78_9AGAR|nr:hypothetical protein NLJ89_g6894 [Agrocybe chaxingu]
MIWSSSMENANGTDMAMPNLPNPFTPMAFLPPDVAFQATIATYVLVGAASVLLWDILSHLVDDYRLLIHFKIGLPTITYFISRFAALTSLVGYVVINTTPIGGENCSLVNTIISSFVPVAIPGTSLLLFFHVCAIYNKNKYIIMIFGFMWIAVIGGSTTAVIGGSYHSLGPTDYCTNASLPSYASAAAIIPTANDFCLYIAIVWRMLRSSYVDNTVKNGVRMMVFGDYLPALSKALLHNGQAYFLSTVGINLLTVTIWYIDSIPLAYRAMFGMPNIGMMNIMACRLFRNTKFGRFAPVSSTLPTKMDKTSKNSKPSEFTQNPSASGSNTVATPLRQPIRHIQINLPWLEPYLTPFVYSQQLFLP